VEDRLLTALRGERVEGIKHPAIALARQLKSEAGRRAAGFYLIHGQVLLERALEAGSGVALVLYTPRLPSGPDGPATRASLVEQNVPFALVSEGTMRAIVERAYVPEIVAAVERRTVPVESVSVGPGSLLLLANGVTNPSNLGMLVRTAYGAGADALLMTEGTTDPFVWQVSTGSTGAIFRLPLVEQVRPDALRRLRADGLLTVAATPQAECEYPDLDYRQPVCFLVGNEATGLTPDVAAEAAVTVRIPMAHHLDSLNVAVAAGILLFEAQRQRGQARC